MTEKNEIARVGVQRSAFRVQRSTFSVQRLAFGVRGAQSGQAERSRSAGARIEVSKPSRFTLVRRNEPGRPTYCLLADEGVSAYRKGSHVTLDLDLGSIGIRQSRSSIRRLAFTPTPDTPIRGHEDWDITPNRHEAGRLTYSGR